MTRVQATGGRIVQKFALNFQMRDERMNETCRNVDKWYWNVAL